MNRYARSSRSTLVATLSVLAPLAAVGCDSTVAGPRALAGEAIEAKALGLESAGSNAKDVGKGLGADKNQYSAASALPTDPVVGAAHGSLLFPDGSTGAVTPTFARTTQQYYIERLLGEATTDVREEFGMRTRPVEGDPREFADNAVLIAWLIEQVRPADASDLESINKYIAKARTAGNLPAQVGLVAGNQTSRQDYMNLCSNYVPTPPDWNPDENDPANRWKKEPNQVIPLFIDGESTTATMWHYESDHLPDETTPPRGTCIALPRANASGVITSLGVICQGNESNAACFWDSTRDFGPTEKVAILSDGFNGGPDLDGGIGGKCTDCHRGKNAFITHPESSLNLGQRLMFPQGWVVPLVHDDWFQNPQPQETELGRVGMNEHTCLGCHSSTLLGGQLPQLRDGKPGDPFTPEEHSKYFKYCNFVIMKAILPGPTKTMPLNWPSEMYRTDQETIATACNWPVDALGFGPRTSTTDPVPPTEPDPARSGY